MEKFFRIWGRLCMMSMPVPAARRLYKQNPVDFGKYWWQLYLLTIPLAIVEIAGIRWAIKKYLPNLFGEEVFEGKFLDGDQPTDEIINRETFEKRFGKLSEGDTITFAHDHENIDGGFVRWFGDDQLVVWCYTGEESGATENLKVSVRQVLDVDPHF